MRLIQARDLYRNTLEQSYLSPLNLRMIILQNFYGIATISRLLKIMGLFCSISSLLQGSLAKETCNFKEPTDCSHPVPDIENSREKVQILKSDLSTISTYKMTIKMTFEKFYRRWNRIYILKRDLATKFTESSHICMSHVSHECMSHVTYMNESCHIRMNESCHIQMNQFSYE